MTTVEAIHWYSGRLLKLLAVKHVSMELIQRIILKALNEWKLRLNKRCELEHIS